MNTQWTNLIGIASVACAKANEWEIEFRAHETYDWRPWKGKVWDDSWLFQGRPKKPKMINVTILVYLSPTGFAQFAVQGSKEDETCKSLGWQRFTKGDLTGEVEE